jgi:hypothetical protein
MSNGLGEEGQVGGEGEITGNVTVDPATGMPLKADLTQLYLLRMEDFMKDVVKKRTINIRNTP